MQYECVNPNISIATPHLSRAAVLRARCRKTETGSFKTLQNCAEHALCRPKSEMSQSTVKYADQGLKADDARVMGWTAGLTPEEVDRLMEKKLLGEAERLTDQLTLYGPGQGKMVLYEPGPGQLALYEPDEPRRKSIGKSVAEGTAGAWASPKRRCCLWREGASKGESRAQAP